MRKRSALSMLSVFCLIVLVGFLQMQSLRPDWHAALHEMSGNRSTCGHHHDHKHDDDGAGHSSGPAHDCQFTAVATGMLVWSAPVVSADFSPRCVGTITLAESRLLARREVGACARAPPVEV